MCWNFVCFFLVGLGWYCLGIRWWPNPSTPVPPEIVLSTIFEVRRHILQLTHFWWSCGPPTFASMTRCGFLLFPMITLLRYDPSCCHGPHIMHQSTIVPSHRHSPTKSGPGSLCHGDIISSGLAFCSRPRQGCVVSHIRMQLRCEYPGSLVGLDISPASLDAQKSFSVHHPAVLDPLNLP